MADDNLDDLSLSDLRKQFEVEFNKTLPTSIFSKSKVIEYYRNFRKKGGRHGFEDEKETERQRDIERQRVVEEKERLKRERDNIERQRVRRQRERDNIERQRVEEKERLRRDEENERKERKRREREATYYEVSSVETCVDRLNQLVNSYTYLRDLGSV